MSGLESIVLTAENLPEGDLFTGFAFSGSDFIVGPEGFGAYTRAGGAIAHHDDGCYLLVRREGAEWVMGSDFKGNCKVFYYQDGDRWAVGNSIADLVSAVRARGWTITVQPHLLSTWEMRIPIWDMCVSYETMVKEIRLLPRWSVLRASPGGIREEIALSLDATESYDAYVEALRTYVETWMGRIGTIAADDEAHITVDVTGGIDSRAVLTLFLGARQHLGIPFDGAIRFKSDTVERRADDLKVAQNLADHYNFTLNRALHVPTAVRRLTGGQQFARWESFAFGSYRPVYEPGSVTDLHALPFGGQGGEGHRQSYASFEDPEALFRRERKRYGDDDKFDQVQHAIETSLAVIARQSPRTPPLLAHFQEFRDRHHAGLNPQYRLRSVPLTGRHLHEASRHLSPEFLLRGQTLRDLHAVTAPGLLAIPYDKPGKAATPEMLRDLIKPLDVSPKLGKVYGLGSAQTPPEDGRSGNFIEIFQGTYRRARRRLPEGVLKTDTLKAADNAWTQLPQERGAPRAAALRLAHCVMFADFLISGD
ncbi:hypothetical protein [Ornithinimicrobium faecis]|uniref:hypothetical protein n=1 Tax=Ornithinimicrobium faecis TaxID=2934158 RepID=UPI002118698F|nr:hypothetical protein [Ornithinimicrobium sp. HY1745]